VRASEERFRWRSQARIPRRGTLRIAFIQADDDIDFQDLADAIARARGNAGVDRVALLTDDGKHEQMAS
jgi:biopolymer transport protein ExbD